MKLLILCALVAVALAAPQRADDDDGQYRPDNSGQYASDGQGGYREQPVAAVTYRPQLVVPVQARVVPVQQYRNLNYYNGDNNGQYRPEGEDDGQYHADNSGQYHGDGSGSYHGDNSGAYANQGEAAYRFGQGQVRPVQPVQVQNVQGRFQGGAQKSVNLRPVVVEHVQGRSGEQYEAQYKNDHRFYKILRREEEILEDGYHYIYETENGIIAEEEGHLVEKGTENEHMSVKGYFSYPGPNNVRYQVDYTSDGISGFVPVGAHLPVAPDANVRVAINQK